LVFRTKNTQPEDEYREQSESKFHDERWLFVSGQSRTSTRTVTIKFRYIKAWSRTKALFPLTPALSLRERVQRGATLENSGGLRFANRLLTILPLPKGEGRGERKEIVRFTHVSKLFCCHTSPEEQASRRAGSTGSLAAWTAAATVAVSRGGQTYDTGILACALAH